MKRKLILLALFVACAVKAQTNIYFRVGIPESKTPTTCGGSNFKRIGEIFYWPSNPPVNGFYSTTNIGWISFTNPSVCIQWDDPLTGVFASGHTKVWWTNNSPTTPINIELYWPSTVNFPTNQLVPLTTFGFTNNP